MRRPALRWARLGTVATLWCVLAGGLWACPDPEPVISTDTADAQSADSAADSATPPIDTSSDVAADSGGPDDVDGFDDAVDSGAADAGAPDVVALACTEDAECATACGAGTCEEGRCHFALPGSCLIPNAAGTEATCVAAGAVEPVTGCLTCNPSVQGQGYSSALTQHTFEAGRAELTIEKLSDAAATWRVTSRRAATGDFSLYFGQASVASYDVGERAAADAVTAALPGIAPGTRLSFQVLLDTEETAGFDTLEVTLRPADSSAEAVVLWHSDAVGGTTYGAFLPVTVGLPASAAGAQIVFRFDSVDGIINDFEGAYLDDITVRSGCCTQAAHCDDGDPCTAAACDAGSCTTTRREGCCLIDADCDDDDPCTQSSCSGRGGSCVIETVSGCCDQDLDCDDGDPCTEDRCSAETSRCANPPLCCSADTECDDGDPCTAGTCDGGQCSYAFACCRTATDCDDGDPCTADACGEDGVCGHADTHGLGCCRPGVFEERFEGEALAEWTVDAANNNIGWRLQAFEDAPSGGQVLYYGHPTLLFYNSGGRNQGQATTPSLRMPDGVVVRLSFDVRLDIEAEAERDRFGVTALVGSREVPLIDKTALSGRDWQAVEVDVSWLAGQQARLRFSFDTVDGQANGTRGVFVDDVRLTSSCQPRPCRAHGECGGPITCLEGACVGGGCVYGGDCSVAE